MTKSKFELPQKEIKFRAWDRKKKEMTYKPRVDDLKIDGTAWLDVNEALKFEERDYVLMQYTGLKDKNGKEIYEGDFVLVNGKKYRVDWIGAGFWFVDVFENTPDVEPHRNQEIEVIGNIYEHPELLEGERKK